MREIIKDNSEAVRRNFRGLYIELAVMVWVNYSPEFFLEPIPIDIWLMKLE